MNRAAQPRPQRLPERICLERRADHHRVRGEEE